MTTKGKQKYLCKDCGSYRTLGTKQAYSVERKEEILRSYKERSSLRGVHRVYGVAITTVLRWLKKKSTD
jgi:transposase-like protein